MKLVGTAVMILPDDNPERTDKGIIIPRTAKDKPITGKVVRIGVRCESVKVGWRVFYERRGASVMEIDGVEHHFVNENQIMAHDGYNTT